MAGHFFAIDVETANAQRSSICQIGLVEVHDGAFISEWSTLIDPGVSFASKNIEIHGIDAAQVSGASVFSDIAHEIRARVDGHYLIGHSGFDKQAIGAAFRENGLQACNPVWLDSAQMARRVWSGSDIISDGAGLGVLTKKLGIKFQHHDALEDAKACAQISLKICEHAGITVSDWHKG